MAIKAHFTLPEVQNIGSSLGCGCAYPSIIFQNDGWPYFPDSEDIEDTESEQLECQCLVRLLRETGDKFVELYGIWAGDQEEKTEASEETSAEGILAAGFRFRERVLYSVGLESDGSTAEKKQV